MPLRRIAILLGTERKTVRRWLRLGHAPLWKKPARGSLLAPYRDVLDRRWAEGCRNAAQLWRELAGLGFAGRPGVVRVWARHRRQQEPPAQRTPAEPTLPVWQPPPSRRLACLLTAETATPSETERAFISHLRSEAPRLAEAAGIARRLGQVLRREGTETLRDVLAAAETTMLAEFAAGLRRDLKAVQAAVDLPWTTSPAEGQINRIKTIKRSMYGRAGFTLLRARVLHAA